MESKSLDGKKGLIVGIANDRSIGYGCARQFVAGGAEVAITYFNEKAEVYVRPLAEELGAPITNKASTFGAIAFTASCRFVVA